MLALGSTTGVFCGHDHYNNMSLEYKGIRLTYGMSIDYLAMPGIAKDTKQRGAERITLRSEYFVANRLYLYLKAVNHIMFPGEDTVLFLLEVGGVAAVNLAQGGGGVLLLVGLQFLLNLRCESLG